MTKPKKLLIVNVAAWSWDLQASLSKKLDDLNIHAATSVFPAVTCTAQASFRTAATPAHHGMVSNGVYSRDLKKAMFWEQASSLVEGDRIWKSIREKGKRVGMMFWQQSLGEDLDLVLSPRPIHKHSGGMIQDCYAKPAHLYQRLIDELGRPFNLMHYWGPLTSSKSSQWIADATCAVMSWADIAPDVLFSYIPHLDYDLQKHGPNSKQAKDALAETTRLLTQLRDGAEKAGYEVLFFGDYAIDEVRKEAVFPNRHLRDAGLFQFQKVKGMHYPDFFASPAFAMVDHEVAHVYTRDADATAQARQALKNVAGIAEIHDREAQRELGLDHARSGDLVLLAEEGSWMAYPWWTDKREAPDFATHIDIHNKPGYDPCELFFGWPPLSVSQDTSRVRGTHGRTGAGRQIAWATSCGFPEQPDNLIDLALAAKKWLESEERPTGAECGNGGIKE